MPTPAPRPRGNGSLQARLREDRKDREQIRRLLSQPQKPVSAAPGGVEGVTRCVPTSFGSYFDPYNQWGTLYASGHNWTTTALAGTAPEVSISTVGDTPNGLDGLVVATDGWYSFRLQFYITFDTGAYQPSSVYAAVVPPRGTEYAPVEGTFAVMSGAIPGAVPDSSGRKRSTGAVPTDAMRLSAGDVVALHVSWDAGTQLYPNADGRPRALVDVTKYL